MEGQETSFSVSEGFRSAKGGCEASRQTVNKARIRINSVNDTKATHRVALVSFLKHTIAWQTDLGVQSVNQKKKN